MSISKGIIWIWPLKLLIKIQCTLNHYGKNYSFYANRVIKIVLYSTSIFIYAVLHTASLKKLKI